MIQRLALGIVLCAMSVAWAVGGSIFDDQDPTPLPTAPRNAQRTPAGLPKASDPPGSPQAQDVLAELKCDDAISSAERAYQQAVFAAKTQLVVDLNAAMDAAMARRNVEDVKRIDAAISKAKEDLKGVSPAPTVAEAPAQAATAAPVAGVHRAHDVPRTVVFLCDCTGSMINKIAQLKIELRRAVEGLRPEQSFNIVFFQDEKVLKVAKSLVPANAENKRLAQAWLGDIVTAGTTDPIPSLTFALKLRPETLYFLTDAADFPNMPALKNVLKTYNADHHTKVNTILFVESQAEQEANRESEPLMRSISGDSGGVFKWVRMDQLK